MDSITNQLVGMIFATNSQPARLEVLLDYLAFSWSEDEFEAGLERLLWSPSPRSVARAQVHSASDSSSPNLFSDDQMNPFGLCRTLPG